MTLRGTRWRYVSPDYEDHLAMLHDPRTSITRQHREHALTQLLRSHAWFLERSIDGYLVTNMHGVDDLVGQEL